MLKILIAFCLKMAEAFFRPELYLLENKDVALAVTRGYPSALQHYLTYGRREGRSYHFFWERSFWVKREIWVTPDNDYWSGVCVQFLDKGHDSSGTVRVQVFRNSSYGKAEATKDIALSDIDTQLPYYIYFDAIDQSAGQQFCLKFRYGQMPADGPLVRLYQDEGQTNIYSNPKSPLPFPKAILFSPVTQCNLNCVHCISAHSRRSVSTISTTVLEEISEAAADKRLKHIRTDYSGDFIFSSDKHRNYFSYIKSLDIPFTIDTHANNLTPEWVRKLLDSKLYSINFSIDSMEPESYAKIRKGSKPLNQVLENIHYFMNEKNKHRPDIKTSISFVLMKTNRHHIAPGVLFAERTGIDKLLVQHIHAYTAPMIDESIIPDLPGYQALFDELSSSSAKTRVQVEMTPPMDSPVASRSHLPCEYPWNSLVVLGNDDAMACCVPGTRVGNLKGRSIAEFWNGPEMQSFRKMINSPTPPAPCQTCPMLRTRNNYASFVPGVSAERQLAFEQKCLETRKN